MTKPVPLKPVDQEWRWQYDGLCRTTSPELFFHPERERDPTRWRRDDRAKQICRQCPVVQQCLQHVLTTHERYGVWGGTSERDRDRMRAPLPDQEISSA